MRIFDGVPVLCRAPVLAILLLGCFFEVLARLTHDWTLNVVAFVCGYVAWKMADDVDRFNAAIEEWR